MVTDFLLFGAACLIIEMIVPGVGIFGIMGSISLLSALFFFLGGDGQALAIIAAVLVILFLVVWILVALFPKSRLWQELTLPLRSTTERGYTGVDERRELLHAEGVAHTVLRPAGTVVFGDRYVDVVAENTFIEAGKRVIVVKVEGGRVVVRPVES